MNEIAKPEVWGELTQEKLREILDYDPQTGVMRWRQRGKGRRGVGKIAGGMSAAGYWKISIGEFKYRRARLAFLYMAGRWPQPVVDHINGHCADDRWINLREATHSQNAANYRPRGTLGIRGVYLTSDGRYRAEIKCLGKKMYLGRFGTAEEAGAAYWAAAQKVYGEFAYGARS